MTVLKPRLKEILIFSIGFLATFGFLFLVILSIARQPEDFKNIFVIVGFLIFCILFGPPVILSITYFYVDLTKNVSIDTLNNRILIKKKGVEQIISKKDIVESYHVCVGEKTGTHYKFPFYEYIMIILKERKRICITNLLCKPEEIIKVLKIIPITIETNVPLIDWNLGGNILTSEEFESKIAEFERTFEDYSNSMLINIIKQRKVYADYAREAASRILKRRKN